MTEHPPMAATRDSIEITVAAQPKAEQHPKGRRLGCRSSVTLAGGSSHACWTLLEMGTIAFGLAVCILVPHIFFRLLFPKGGLQEEEQVPFSSLFPQEYAVYDDASSGSG